MQTWNNSKRAKSFLLPWSTVFIQVRKTKYCNFFIISILGRHQTIPRCITKNHLSAINFNSRSFVAGQSSQQDTRKYLINCESLCYMCSANPVASLQNSWVGSVPWGIFNIVEGNLKHWGDNTKSACSFPKNAEYPPQYLSTLLNISQSAEWSPSTAFHHFI